MHGALRAATARKSFSFAPGSRFLGRKRKISRGYACKSGRARSSTFEGDVHCDQADYFDELQTSSTKRFHSENDVTDTTFEEEDGEAHGVGTTGSWSCYGMPRTRVSLEGITTTVDMGTGSAMKISAVQLAQLFDLDPKLVLADVAHVLGCT